MKDQNQLNQKSASKDAKINSNASNASKKGNASNKKDAISKDIQKNIESKLRDIPRGGMGINSPSIYKMDKEIWDAMGDRERKSFRRKMRSNLQRFSNQILGKDRSDEERLNACKEFKKYFKENYLASKLDASAIYQGSNDSKRKEYQDMIEIIEILS